MNKYLLSPLVLVSFASGQINERVDSTTRALPSPTLEAASDTTSAG
jgi:hypothetical protein